MAEGIKNKIKYILLIVLIILVLLGGIYIISNRSANENPEVKTNSINFNTSKELTIEDFKIKLQENGFTLTDSIEKSAVLIGAKEGISYEIDGDFIEVYKFDEKSSDELTKNNIKSAKTDEFISMPSFNNITLKAKYHKGLCLVNYQNHPDKEKILEIFNNL